MPYAVGDTAGFSEKEASAILELKVAKKVKTTESKNTPANKAADEATKAKANEAKTGDKGQDPKADDKGSDK